MEDRTVNDELIHFLRQITADGIVDKQEIWDLGTLLQVNDDARAQWPGPLLWEILQQIFEDNVVTDEEAADLTKRLRGIEKECHDRVVSAAAVTSTDEDYAVRELNLPAIDLSLEIESHLPTEAPAQVDLKKHTCTCADWTTKRASYPASSIGRLCRCMSTAFERALNGLPDLYEQMGPHLVNLIRLLSTYGLGGIAEAEWRLLEGAGFHHFVSWNRGEWIAVFTENDEGLFERFSYNRSEKRWAFGVKPVGEGELLHFFGTLGGE